MKRFCLLTLFLAACSGNFEQTDKQFVETRNHTIQTRSIVRTQQSNIVKVKIPKQCPPPCEEPEEICEKQVTLCKSPPSYPFGSESRRALYIDDRRNLCPVTNEQVFFPWKRDSQKPNHFFGVNALFFLLFVVGTGMVIQKLQKK